MMNHHWCCTLKRQSARSTSPSKHQRYRPNASINCRYGVKVLQVHDWAVSARNQHILRSCRPAHCRVVFLMEMSNNYVTVGSAESLSGVQVELLFCQPSHPCSTQSKWSTNAEGYWRYRLLDSPCSSLKGIYACVLSHWACKEIQKMQLIHHDAYVSEFSLKGARKGHSSWCQYSIDASKGFLPNDIRTHGDDQWAASKDQASHSISSWSGQLFWSCKQICLSLKINGICNHVKQVIFDVHTTIAHSQDPHMQIKYLQHRFVLLNDGSIDWTTVSLRAIQDRVGSNRCAAWKAFVGRIGRAGHKERI